MPCNCLGLLDCVKSADEWHAEVRTLLKDLQMQDGRVARAVAFVHNKYLWFIVTMVTGSPRDPETSEEEREAQSTRKGKKDNNKEESEEERK